jgi:HD superfamily phosphohydrolase YqeK
MGKIAQVIYAADFISEDRQISTLNKIRKEIERDFESGLYLITTNVIKYQLEQDNFIHPYSNDLRNKLLKRSD